MVIQNVISLCFFVAGCFYEHQRKITDDPQAQFICSLANSKGKPGRRRGHQALLSRRLENHGKLYAVPRSGQRAECPTKNCH